MPLSTELELELEALEVSLSEDVTGFFAGDNVIGRTQQTSTPLLTYHGAFLETSPSGDHPLFLQC